MRWTSAAATAVPLLLLLLTWLSLHAADTDAERFDRALGIIDDFASIETGLHLRRAERTCGRTAQL